MVNRFSRHLLSCALVLGVAAPLVSAPRVATAAAADDASKTLQSAVEDLAALRRAGIHTHGHLAKASTRKLAPILGRSRARALQRASRAHIGSGGLLDAKTPLDVLGVIDPAYVITPIFKPTPRTKARLAEAERQRSSLARAGVETYVDVAGADAKSLGRVVGASRAKAMIARARIILAHAGVGLDGERKEGAVALIDPTYATGTIAAAFVAFPGITPIPSPMPIPGIEPNPSPIGKTSANPTPYP